MPFLSVKKETKTQQHMNKLSDIYINSCYRKHKIPQLTSKACHEVCFFVCPNVVVGNKIIVMFCYYIVLVSHFPTKPVDCRLCVILEFSWLIKYHFLLCLLNQFNMIYIHVVWLNFNMFWLVAKLLKHSVPVTYVELLSHLFYKLELTWYNLTLVINVDS